jgi:hypothetical protein
VSLPDSPVLAPTALLTKPLNSKTLTITLVVASVVALAAVAAWYNARSALKDVRTQIVTGTLEPMAVLLKENEALVRELQAEPFTQKGQAILESYLDKIRRDGVAKHADMKQRLDQLAENNTAIVTLIKVYSTHARAAAFTTEADKFRNYASAWRDRWNSVMELFMAGGSYPASEIPFPKGFPDVVQAEIVAAR